jgi:hypothetical protein
MTADSRFETMRTSYGRTVEVGRLCLSRSGARDERVIVDVPRENPEYDDLWLALSPAEARDLAGRLIRHAAAAESPASVAGAGSTRPVSRAPSRHLDQ